MNGFNNRQEQMNQARYTHQLAWQRRLSPDDQAQVQAYLAAHPEAQADWEAERQLNQLLDQLPQAPLSSNFTAQVLHAVRQRRQGRLAPVLNWWRGLWLGRPSWQAVLTILVVSGVLLGYYQYRSFARAEIARSVATVSTAASVPRVEWLQDFEAIHRLSQVPPVVDDELLAALQ